MARVSPIVLRQRAGGASPFGARSAGAVRASPRFRGLGESTVSGAVSGARIGAAAGAAAGSVVPILGNTVGAILGGIGGAIASAFNRTDPESTNFNQATAIYNAQGANGALNIANKYLVLAGLFDLQPHQIKGNIPIYKKYGRMGEEQFVRDMTAAIRSCALTGTINGSDTPVSVYDKCVQPWIDGFGFGPMADANAGLIDTMLLGMTAEYLAGAQTRWYAVGGQWPFGNIPAFSLPNSVTAGAAPAQAPPSVISAIAPTAPTITAPIVLYDAPGKIVTSAINGTLNTPQGSFTFSAPGPSGVVVVNNRDTNTVGTQLLYDGKAVYVKAPDGSIDIYTNGGFQLFQPPPAVGSTLPSPAPVPASSSAPALVAPVPISVTPAPPTPVVQTPTSVAIPNGFQLAGNANGLGAYLGPDGLYYTWSGTTMAPLTGALTTVNGQQLTVTAGLPASAANLYPNAAALTTNTQAGTSPYASMLSYPPSYPATAALTPPATFPSSTAQAGLFGGGSNTTTLLLGGGILLAVFLSMRPSMARRGSR